MHSGVTQRTFERRLGALTVGAIGLLLVGFIAGPWIMLALLVLIGAWVLAGRTGVWFSPDRSVDAYYSSVDEELDRAAAAARVIARAEVRRMSEDREAQAALYPRGNVVSLPSADVIEFPSEKAGR